LVAERIKTEQAAGEKAAFLARFELASSDSVRDTKTSLTWTRHQQTHTSSDKENSPHFSWLEANQRCTYLGMRLPTYSELRSIVHQCSELISAPCTVSSHFLFDRNEHYWTSDVIGACTRDLQSNFECSSDDLAGQSERDIELEADQFASTLLMPLDDLRTQVDGQAFNFDLIKHCSNRYGVSLTAAARQCAEVCEQRVVVAVAIEGVLVKAWPSRSAFRSGAYLPTRKQLIEVPKQSIAHTDRCNGESGTAVIAASVWFPKETQTQVTEHTLVSKANDSTMILLVLPKADHRFPDADESDEERLESTDARFRRMGQTES
jgi:hypothetical protein